MDISVAIQFSSLLNRHSLDPRDIKIFHIIVEIVSGSKGYISNELLIKRSSYCERTISTSLANLKNCGLIEIKVVNRKNFITCNLDGM